MKISNKIKTLAVCGVLALTAVFNVGYASAAQVYCPNGETAETLEGCDGLDSESNKGNLMSVITGIINVLIGVIGFVAVIVIILGGVQYTTSAGDPGKVKKAKDTIMYGIIGLVVAILAFAIVNFVLSSLTKSGESGAGSGSGAGTSAVLTIEG